MAVSELSHGSLLFHCDLPVGEVDYVSPGLFGLVDQTNDRCSMERLLDYSIDPHTHLLPILEYQNIESCGSGVSEEPVFAVDYPPTRTSTGEPLLQYNNKPAVSKYGNECNYPSWYYSTSSQWTKSNVVSFDRLGNHAGKLGDVPDQLLHYGTHIIQYNSEETAMEDRILEEQLRWLYPGDNLDDCDGLLGAALKRTSTAANGDDVAARKKRHCSFSGSDGGGGMKKKSGKTSKVCKDPQSIAAKMRREKIRERLKVLQELVPNSTKVDLVTMLEKSISYVKFLQLQVKVLETDEIWAGNGNGGRTLADELKGEEKEAIDAILSSHVQACTSTAPLHFRQY